MFVVFSVLIPICQTAICLVRSVSCIDRSACFADYTFQLFYEKTLVGRLYSGTYALHAR